MSDRPGLPSSKILLRRFTKNLSTLALCSWRFSFPDPLTPRLGYLSPGDFAEFELSHLKAGEKDTQPPRRGAALPLTQSPARSPSVGGPHHPQGPQVLMENDSPSYPAPAVRELRKGKAQGKGIDKG